MKRIFLLAAVFTLSVSGFMASGQNQQLPNDPEVRKGKLENGLTYYIRHNDKPARRAEFYLATNVGAIQETPDQDGLAHFLEHMCFNGTKNFPDKELLNWLQKIGASFGGNVNAATGIDQTQYMLNNIPLIRETVVDSCLLVLHDYSHFVTNDPSEIDKERPVIIEEKRTRRNAGWRTFEKSLPYLYGDSKYATCTLIGSQENLETFKPESLVNFYQTWYRPDMQAVVVVGDIDVDAVEAKIKAIWADVPAAVNPKAKDVIEFKEFSEPRVAVITDPETTIPSVELIWESQAQDEALNSTVAGLYTDLFEDIVSLVMSERFEDITAKADAPYNGASFGIGKLCEAFEGVIGDVSLKENNILDGFKSFAVQIEKMKRYGFTEAEVSRAKENIISSYEKSANQAESRKNPEFIRPLINNFFDNEPYMDPATECEIAKSILGMIDAATLNQMLPMLITDNNLVVIYSGPEKEGIKTPTKEQLLEALSAAAAAEIEAPAEEVSDASFLDDSALAGSRVKGSATTIYGATEWILGNGVKVIVRPTEYKKDQILFNISKAGGESLISDADMASFDDNIYGMFSRIQGISKFKGTEVTKMLSGKNISVNAYIESLYHGVSGSSTVKDLETAFQLLYLEYADPRFDEEEWNTAITQLGSILPNLENRPDFKFQKTMVKTLYGDNPRTEIITMDKLAKADLKVVESNYRKLFSNANGATMVITGDVDLDTLKPLVEKYIGSLPSGRKTGKWNKVDSKIAKGNVVVDYNTTMETPLSTVLQVYSYYKNYTVQDEVMAKAVSYILDQVYTETLREEEGGTYGASSNASGRKNPSGRYLLQVAFNCKPEMTDKLRDLAKDGFRKLAENGPTDEQFVRTIEHFKKSIPENRINNSYWISSIMDYANDGIDYDKEYDQAVSSLSKESIQKAAKAFYKSGNFIEIAQKPEQ